MYSFNGSVNAESLQTQKLLRSLNISASWRTGVTNHYISNIIHHSEHLLYRRFAADSLPGCIYIFWRQSRYMWRTV